jgi:hypothetical protein
MKKWSIISSLVVVAALAMAAFATTGIASAVGPYEPYCPAGEEGTPPNCHPHEEGGGGGGEQPGGGGGGTTNPPPPPPPPPPPCATGQIGTYPNCVTPALDVGSITVKPNSSTVTFKVNAPGKVKVSGKGIATTTVSVKAGNVKIKVKLTKEEKEKLKKQGKLTLKVKVTYTPTGGTPVTKTVKITFKAPPTHKGHKGHK